MGVNEVVKDIFAAMRSKDFHKTMLLDNFPETYGDVYYVNYDDMTWYVKFIEDSERVRIRVLSCKWDGSY